MEVIFFLSISSILFIYGGYGLLLFFVNKIPFFKRKVQIVEGELPSIALVIAAYNEADILIDKIRNTLSLQYPSDKLHVYLVTDGSNDHSNQIVEKFPNIKLFWEQERKGKTAAINRVMQYVTESVTVFTDANVMLNHEALHEIAKHYKDECVGGVSGEKRVQSGHSNSASTTEGLYWKYESFIKNQEAQFAGLVGAAGELFSIRTSLFRELPTDTLLDDFMISMQLVREGYRVDYEPNAYASELPSLNIKEEYKRKVRIAVGGIQSVLRLKDFLNPMKYGFFSFQYFFHRVSRWLFMPILMALALGSNLILCNTSLLYASLLFLQGAFYLLGVVGWFMERANIRSKLFYIPYYFNFMHICIVAGWIRYLRGNQSAAWEKSSRAVQI